MPKLIPPRGGDNASDSFARPMESAKHIPISLIDPNPHQPRHEISADDIAELTASIQANGVIEPLVVSPKENRYCLIAGYRRLTASKHAGLIEVPCIIREGSEVEMLELALLENIQRADLTYIEEAESYKHLMEVAGIDQKSVALKMNKATTTVSDRLALLSLPSDIQEMVVGKKLSIKAALEVGRLTDPKRRATLASKADKLTLEVLKDRVQKVLTKQKLGRKKYEKRTAHPMFKEIFEGLPVKRVYKDQVTFVFKDETEFINSLRRIIERYDSENRE